METYLVGGAVRDRLLGLPVTEKDWVVVGATEAEMQRLGYRAVGRDFPVFLHPATSEEYALARTERKTGKGHTGFECDTDAVTLEDDLKRRDLTINAIAQDDDGNLVDPWGGVHDITHRVLRHVSAAFDEDPLRVLRVARFAARFTALGFTVHPSTISLMRTMVRRGDLSELAPERVWLELEKALATDHPDVFIKVLDQVGAGAVLWPELAPTAANRLEHIAGRTHDPRYRYAALLLELTPRQADAISKRLRGPNRMAEFSRLAAEHYHPWCEGAGRDPRGAVELLYSMDAFRQPERFRELNTFFGLITDSPDASLTVEYWRNCHATAAGVTTKDIDPALTGVEIGDAIRAEQIRRIELNRE